MRKIFAALCFLGALATSAWPAQNNLFSPTTGTVSGLTLTTNYNNAFSALVSCNSGATAPANDQSALAVKGQCWLDTSSTPNTLKVYDGTTWLTHGWIDPVNHVFSQSVGGGVDSVSSAGTTDLCSKTPYFLTISGTTTITSFGSSCDIGQQKVLTFSGVLTLTHSANLLLPNAGSNITTAATDRAIAIYSGGGIWTVTTYMKADGSALQTSANFSGAATFSGIISPTALASGTTDNYAPTGFSTAETLRLTPNAAGSTIGGIAGGASGRQITIQNIGTANITLSAGTSSTGANRFQLTSNYIVRPDEGVQIRYDGTTSRWRTVPVLRTDPVAGSSRNLAVTVASNTTATFTADSLVVENATGSTYRLTSVSVALNTASSGAGGLDTSTMASATWYSAIVIYNPATNTAAALISVQASCLSATLPSGYTHCIRVGWLRTAAGNTNLMGTKQVGRRAQYVVGLAQTTALPIMDSGAKGSVDAPTWQSIAWANFAPTTSIAITMATHSFVQNAGIAASAVIAAPNNSYGGRTSTTNIPPCVTMTFSSSNVASYAGQQCTMALESSNVYWASGSASDLIAAFGWEDNF